MNYHRITALALAGVLSLSVLAACGGKDDPAPEETSAPVESTAPVESETPEVTETPEATATPEATETPEATPAPESTPAPEATPTPAPSEPTPEAALSVQTIWSDIEALDLPSFMDLDADLLSVYYGIDAADLVEYVGKMPMMNVQATEFFIAKVQPGKMDAVKAGVEQRQADLVAEWSQYLPEQLKLVENAQIVTNGDYIMFAVSAVAEDAVSIFNDYTK